MTDPTPPTWCCMTRPTGEDAMSSEHVEVLERLRGVLEHGKMGDKCLIAPDLVTAAIAALSAPQPPAEAPPSAPVGVEDGPIDASDNAEYIEYCADRLERCGLRVTAGALRVIAQEHRALAQQPAAVDGALRAEVERLRLLAGNQHELMKAHGVPLPEDYALPAAADAFVKEYVARRERATRAEAEVEALRRDAERYRWLRDRHDKTHQDWHVRDQWNNVPAIGGLDAAIDAAREARNG